MQQFEKQISNNLLLMKFRFMNVCVKAEPAAQPKPQAHRAMPQRDEKGRFISKKDAAEKEAATMLSAKRGSDVFHKPGCRYFDPKGDIKFRTPHEAEKAGFRPCKVCGGK